MTIIDTTLYANGALRLSRHGAGRGGTVLTHVPTGRQFTVPDNETADLADEIEKYAATSYGPESVFNRLARDFSPVGQPDHDTYLRSFTSR